MFKKLFAVSIASTLKVLIPIAFIATSALDVYSSRGFKYTGGLEGTRIFQDEYGDFSTWRYSIAAGIALALGLIVNWWMDSYIPAAVVLVLGALTRFLMSVFKNLKNAANNRETQWSDFRFLRLHGRLPTSPAFMAHGKRYRFRLSQWIYVNGVDIKDQAQVAAAKAEILSKLRAAVEQPEKIWFTKHWYETDWRIV